MTVNDSLLTIAMALSTLAMVSFVSGQLFNVIRMFRVRAGLKEELFRRAIGSNDLATLGSYLDNQIGAVTLAKYADSEDTRRRVDAYLHAVQSLVGTEQEVRSERPIQPPAGQLELRSSRAMEPSVPVDDQRLRILKESTEGEVWNSLIKLRIEIEKALRAALGKEYPPEGRFISARQLAAKLVEAGELQPGEVEELEYVLSSANRAIHGLEVEPDDARRAVTLGLGLLQVWQDRWGGSERAPQRTR